jgi:hypothetical protein
LDVGGVAEQVVVGRTAARERERSYGTVKLEGAEHRISSLRR